MIIKYNNHLLFIYHSGSYGIALTKQQGTVYEILYGLGIIIGHLQNNNKFQTILFDSKNDNLLYIGAIILNTKKYKKFIKSIKFIIYNNNYAYKI